MKKFVVFLMIFVMIFTVGAFAKKKKKKSKYKKKTVYVEWAKQDQLVTTDPIALLFRVFNAHYEKKLSNNTAWAANAYLYFPYLGPGWSSFGFGVGGEYNFYFQKKALNGWFAGPGADLSIYMYNYSYSYLNPFPPPPVITIDESSTGVAVGVGGQGGYRWIWPDGWVVDVKAVVRINIGGGTPTYAGTTAAGVGWFLPRIGASVGYAWD